jgi:hypothetical protein
MLSTAQAQKLMTQGHVLGDEICTPLKDDGDNGENQWELEGHPAKDTLNLIRLKTQQFRCRMQY